MDNFGARFEQEAHKENQQPKQQQHQQQDKNQQKNVTRSFLRRPGPGLHARAVALGLAESLSDKTRLLRVRVLLLAMLTAWRQLACAAVRERCCGRLVRQVRQRARTREVLLHWMQLVPCTSYRFHSWISKLVHARSGALGGGGGGAVSGVDETSVDSLDCVVNEWEEEDDD
jgi:hypothetical protein